jgi:hypothetical protein
LRGIHSLVTLPHLCKNQLVHAFNIRVHSLPRPDHSHYETNGSSRPVAFCAAASGASCSFVLYTFANMFSTFAATADPSTLDDGSYLFDQSNDDLLSLPLSNDSIHLKGSIAPMSGLSNLDYGRDSASSSVHYGDSHDTSEPSTGHLSGREEREGSTPGAFINGYGSNYTPSPLQYPFTPSSNAGSGPNHMLNKSSLHVNGTQVHEIAKGPVTSQDEHRSIHNRPQDNHNFMAGTPQSSGRHSQSSATPEAAQSQQKPNKHRRVN